MRKLWTMLLEQLLQVVAGFIITALLGVVILLWVSVRQAGQIETPLWAIIVCVLGIAGTVGIMEYFHAREIAKKDKEIEVLTRIAELDDSVFELLPNLSGHRSQDAYIRRLVREFLADVNVVFNDVISHAAVLWPDPQDRNLVPWVSYRISAEGRRQLRFRFQSASASERGVPGQTFLDRRLRLVHIMESEKGRHAEIFTWDQQVWMPDDATSFREFRRLRHVPRFQALVTVAIVGRRGTTLGVLCLYSEDQTMFDSPEIADLLLSLGIRLATIMLLVQDSGPPQAKRTGPT